MDGYRKLAIVGIAIVVVGAMAVLKVPADMFTSATEWIAGMVTAFVTGNLIEHKLNNSANATPTAPEVK